MSSVFQQIILDKITCTPGGSGDFKITRDMANCGLLVKLSLGSNTQDSRNKDAFASPVVELVARNTTDIIFGVLGDYHNERACSIYTKGRIIVANAGAAYTDTYLGFGIQPSAATNQFAKAQAVSSGGIGLVLGGYTREVTNHYLIVDVNLP